MFAEKSMFSRIAVLGFALPVLGSVLCGLSSCASTGDNDITGFDQITLAPGDTGTCESSPCQVSLTIPAGSGSYEVTGNGTKLGTYPAGQTSMVGSFWQSQAIEIVGMDVPKAYAYIPQQP